MAKRKPKVLVIGTGGVIGANLVKGKWKYGEFTQEDLVSLIPTIRTYFDVKTTNIFRMDSAEMRPEHWLTLANAIYYGMKDYDGIVVTMGLDTMNYAASAISFLVQEKNIPIVFTGAQVDPSQVNSDARMNLREAITVAGMSDIAETLVVINHKIIRAVRAKRTNASEYRAFRSFGVPELGEVQQFISLRAGYREKSKSKPVLYNKLETRVAVVKVYPGFDPAVITGLVDRGARGIVLEGFGLGIIPLLDEGMKEALKHAQEKGVQIVITSFASLGNYWQEIYGAETGDRLRKLKVIPVYDMLTETAYVKLMWVLAQAQGYAKVKEMMQRDYCGEITEHGWKVGQ